MSDPLSRLVAGDPAAVSWLRGRTRERARPRFTRWAWAWIEEDFVGDLLLQLVTTCGAPGFALVGDPGAYVDTAISNLCTKYFRGVARLRAGAPVEAVDDPNAARSSPALERIAAALDARRVLLSLSPECRRLLVEKYALGRSLDEMGTAAGVESKTVRSRLHGCRERARAEWEAIRHGRTNVSPLSDSRSSRGNAREVPGR